MQGINLQKYASISDKITAHSTSIMRVSAILPNAKMYYNVKLVFITFCRTCGLVSLGHEYCMPIVS